MQGHGVHATYRSRPDYYDLRFYRDGQLLGEYTHKDAAALATVTNLRPQVSAWNGEANVVMTRYVNDVRITPAQ